MSGRHHRDDSEWRTVDFHPAPASQWLIITLDEFGNVDYETLPGWLVQEVVQESSGETAGRVIAAVHQYGELVPVYEAVDGFWYVGAATAGRPSIAEIKTEIERREAMARAAEALNS